MSAPSAPTITFSTTASRRYGPRVGTIFLRRPGQDELKVSTPGFVTTTSRGVVPHLSRDHQRGSSAIRWVNVPFETFLEHKPPVPTLQPGNDPLHTFLGFKPARQIVSMSAREPYDGRQMPPNGNDQMSVYSLRGVRRVSPADWRSYVQTCKPDAVFALSDTPFTDPPYSQKRLAKSIERSVSWLTNLLKPSTSPLNIFIQMSGGTSIPARRAFSDALVENLHGSELDAISPFRNLDEGVLGYTFDLVPLRQSLEATHRKEAGEPPVQLPTTTQSSFAATAVANEEEAAVHPALPSHTDSVIPLLQASLDRLAETKVRLVNSAEGPHEILRLIEEVGVDVFDARWVQRAADIGVGLDFEFPVRREHAEENKQIGHNLYDEAYALDFGSIGHDTRVCPCAACSPISPTTFVRHGVDSDNQVQGDLPVQHSRAYIHHLLHTHEMSAHALLVLHNLAVLDAFFEGVRNVISYSESTWHEQVQLFSKTYSATFEVFAQAKKSWKEVEMARGKGRLAREREKEEAEVPVDVE